MTSLRKTFLVLLLLFASFSFAMTLLPRVAKADSTASSSSASFFEDAFSGTSIDSTKWNTSLATGGLRWCSVGIPSPTNLTAGGWQDSSQTPCNGTTQGAPYGSISVGGGLASFSALSSRAFPYIWRGPPSRPSPFPTAGDFVLEVRMQYAQITGAGVGFTVDSYSGTDPVGDNPTNYPKRILTIWADTLGLRVGLLSGQASVPDNFGLHDYVLAYVNGQYSLTLDGLPLLQPIASNVRANAIWVGNPFFAFWAVQDWSSFSLSLVRVSQPTLTASPDSGSLGTLVTIQGSGFPLVANGLSELEITFDSPLMGFAFPQNGSFTFVFNVPHADPTKMHHIHAIDLFPSNLDVQVNFTVLPEPVSRTLSASLSTGALYFPGDSVTIYVQTALNGGLVGPAGVQLQVSVMSPNGTSTALNAASVGTGLYKASFTIPKTGSTGTYAITATASMTGAQASALGSFEVKSSWLSTGGPAILSALGFPQSMPNVAIVGMIVAGVAVLGLALLTRRRGK